MKRRAHNRRQWSGTGTSASAPREQFLTRARHPAAKRGNKVEPVSILQGVDESAGNVVVTHNRPRAAIGRRIGDGLHRQHAGTGIISEWYAEAIAIGRRDEAEFRPAFRTQRRVSDESAA